MFQAIYNMGYSIFQFVFDLYSEIEVIKGVSIWSVILVIWIGMALIKVVLSSLSGAALGSSISGIHTRIVNHDKVKDRPKKSTK